MALSDSRRRPSPDVTLRRVPHPRRVSLVARNTLRTCRAHYPGGSKRVHVSIASPSHAAFPKTLGGSASALSLSRPAQASLALRPARLLNRPRRPLSRGFDGASCPATPPDSYQRNRLLAGWNPPPQVFRTFEAHRSLRTSHIEPNSTSIRPICTASVSRHRSNVTTGQEQHPCPPSSGAIASY